MIRRRRLRLTPGTVRTLPDPQDPSLPQVAPTQPGPAAPLPPPAPAPATPAAPPADPEPPPPPAKKPTRDASSAATPRHDASASPRREPDELAMPLQLELTRTASAISSEADLPRPKDDRVGRPVRGVWMLGDDDDRLLRRGTREDLWSLQRSQQRPQAVI